MDISNVGQTARYMCYLCGCRLADENLRAHFKSREHFQEHIKLCLWLYEEPLLRNKRHVSISCLSTPKCLPSACIQAELYKQTELKMRVQVSSASANAVILLQCFLLEPSDVVHLDDFGSSSDMENQVHLSPGSVHDVRVSCKAKDAGVERTGLVFRFQEDTPEKRSFVIVRFLEVACFEDPSDSSVLKTQEPYEYHPVFRRLPDAAHIISIDGFKRKHQIDSFIDAVPAIFEKIRQYGFKPWKSITATERAALEEIRKLLESPLCKKNYHQYFTALLNLEGAQLITDVRNYDMIGVSIVRCKSETTSSESDAASGKSSAASSKGNAASGKGNSASGKPGTASKQYYTLEVPGAKDGRPSVIRRNRLFFRAMSNDAGPVTEYEAIVCETKDSKVKVETSKAFAEIYEEGSKFCVRFTPNFIPLRRMLHAVDACRKKSLYNFVFPSCSPPSKPAIPASSLRFFNKKVQQNPEACKAVEDMLRGEHRPFPYILFGPPGTGKSTTLVEALKQMCTVMPSSRILVVAPSNSACDLLAEQLLGHLNPSEMLRLYSSTVQPVKVSKKLEKYSNYKEGFEEQYESNILMTFKVIVTTLVTSAKLGKAGLVVNCFTHIVVDEAGQASEPECIIPLMELMRPWSPGRTGTGGHVILAGDPMQLGPVVSSKLSSSYGLGVSLLERLINMPAYRNTDGQSSHMMTKLLRNFRSHADILQVPNEMFYKSELQVYADEGISKSLLLWEELPTKGVPLLFHGVSGQDRQDGTCPSYFNSEEIKVVLKYVASLLSWGNGLPVRLREEDIGIISPYRKQVAKIRSELAQRGHKKITVGSTEEFQGQERMVVIATTVRSTKSLVPKHFCHRLGFLSNPKRFNVSVTRAKALMIIVGNPRILCQDPCWKRLVQFCFNKGAYRGMWFEPEILLD